MDEEDPNVEPWSSDDGMQHDDDEAQRARGASPRELFYEFHREDLHGERAQSLHGSAEN